MREKDAAVARSFLGIYQYIGSHPDEFGEIIAGKTYAQFGKTIARLVDHAAQQAGRRLTAAGATNLKNQERRQLLKQLAAIVSIAEVGTLTAPHLVVKMPRRTDPTLLAAAAAGIAHSVSPYKDDFIAAGLPHDFLERLAATSERMLNAALSQRGDYASSHGSGYGIEADLALARKLLKSIHKMAVITLQEDPARLAEWRSVKRLTGPSHPQLPAPVPPRLLSAGKGSEQASADSESVTQALAKGIRRLLPGRSRAPA